MLTTNHDPDNSASKDNQTNNPVPLGRGLGVIKEWALALTLFATSMQRPLQNILMDRPDGACIEGEGFFYKGDALTELFSLTYLKKSLDSYYLIIASPKKVLILDT